MQLGEVQRENCKWGTVHIITWKCVCEIGIALLLFLFVSYAVENPFNDSKLSFDILKQKLKFTLRWEM
jgi:hypothetical protein